MNTLILTMLLTLCGQADIQDCPELREQDNMGRVVAQHAVSVKTGQTYVIINPKLFYKMSEVKQIDTLAHELAHDRVWVDHGKKSLNHGHKFKTACKVLTEGTDARNGACKKSV